MTVKVKKHKMITSFHLENGNTGILFRKPGAKNVIHWKYQSYV